MSSKAMSFKAKINNYAKSRHVPAQVVLQNVMFERFLERLSVSPYREKFVIKGGMLISALVGLDTRMTMDLDTTIRNLPLTEEQVKEAIRNICDIKLEDEVTFLIKSVAPIRKDDLYGGYRVRLDAIYETILTPLSIDVSTGDVITPEAVEYEFGGVLDDSVRISLWGYSIETVLAEKVETILNRDVTNTRPRDYYDVYILAHEKKYDPMVFRKALEATSIHRGSWERISNHERILKQIEQSKILHDQWDKYRREFSYARDITFEDTIASVKAMLY